jgi:ABC-type lipoprotein release transport system permease subunit
MGDGTAAAWHWVRLDTLRRWRSLVLLVLLVAVSAGTVLGAAAAARRGDTALERLVARTLPATVVVLSFQPGFDWDRVRAMPEVEALSTFVDTDFRVEGIPPDNLSVGYPPGDLELMRTIERPVVLQGRLADPTRADEAVVTPAFVHSYGKGVGARLDAVLPTVEQAQNKSITGTSGSGPRIRVRVVGVVRSPWFADGPQSYGSLLPTPALLSAYRQHLVDDTAWFNALIRLRGGGAAVPAFAAHLAAVTGRADLGITDLGEQLRRRQQAAAFEASWLLAFALAAFVAAVVLVGQTVARFVAASAGELRILRAVGMSRSQAVAAAAAGPSLAGLAGAVLGACAAVATSWWTPLGSAAADEPAPGPDVDALVLTAGVAVTVLLVVAGSVLAARRATAAPHPRAFARRSSLADAAAVARLPVAVVLGARFALERMPGRAGVPVRPALLGAVGGVLGVVAAVTFSAGAGEAAENPARFGQTWQLETWLGFGGQDIVPPGLLPAVARDPNVTAVNDWRAASASYARHGGSLLVYSFSPVGTGVPVVLSAGRLPHSAAEIVLAPESAAALHAGVGDDVSLVGTTGTPRSMAVSGLGLVPAGSHCATCSHASGAWVTDSGFDALFRTFQFHGAFVAVRPGADPAVVAERLQRDLAVVGGPPVAFAPPYPPFAVAEIRQVRPFPVALGAFLALLALAAVGHAVTTGVRHRRSDLAVLRALGMTRGQTRAIVAAQATVLALIGVVVGLPLGVALGRTVWRAVAGYTPLEYVPPLPILTVLVVAPSAVLLANLLAAWPARRAAGTHVASVLRAE